MVIRYSNKLVLLLLLFLFSVVSQNTYAELFNTKNNKSKDTPPIAKKIGGGGISTKTKKPPSNIEESTIYHIRNMASFCIGKWENQDCIKELSSIAMDTTTNYAELLDAANKKSSMEPLKQHCAASTAALKMSVPAYAIKSAITECVNIIADINDKTAVKPNLNLYQLMVSSVMCLDKKPSCKEIETKLSSFK